MGRWEGRIGGIESETKVQIIMMMMEGPRALGKEDDGVGLRNNRSNLEHEVGCRSDELWWLLAPNSCILLFIMTTITAITAIIPSPFLNTALIILVPKISLRR